jgi:hypothetical protein
VVVLVESSGGGQVHAVGLWNRVPAMQASRLRAPVLVSGRGSEPPGRFS